MVEEDMKKELIKLLTGSKVAYKLWTELYQRKWGGWNGPSVASSCKGKGRTGRWGCGCWVHQLLKYLADEQ